MDHKNHEKAAAHIIKLPLPNRVLARWPPPLPPYNNNNNNNISIK
jgi:hypothetical protein